MPIRLLTHPSLRRYAGILTILGLAVALRGMFFVGFGLGDDIGYISLATQILDGNYPELHPLNQYAYRPLLLLLFSAGIGLFGLTDVGIVAPVLLASLATIVCIWVCVRRLIAPGAAAWCALVFAFEPFNVVNSTTMTNDVILAFLIFAAVTLFLIADRETAGRRSLRLFASSGTVLMLAFLVKITLLPALGALGLYSAWTAICRPHMLRRQAACYAAFGLGLACTCIAYYLATGDPLWQFKAELTYYNTYKPDWYVAGKIHYRALMLEYPISLFGRSGYGSFLYRDHGFLFWLFLPAAIWTVARSRREAVLPFFVVFAFIVFAFFQFYPQYTSPNYLPLVRQTRYLEMLLPAVAIVVGTALYQLHRRTQTAAYALTALLLGDFVYEASRRAFLYEDSQKDTRDLARYARATIGPTGRPLYVDGPARNSLAFFGRDLTFVRELSSDGEPPPDAYVAFGGARSFWWARDLVADWAPDAVPENWVVSYVVPEATAAWRPTPLRVYYTMRADAVAAVSSAASCSVAGIREIPYPTGFDHPPEAGRRIAGIPDIIDGQPLTAPHLEWIGWIHVDEGTYTLESTSDDGSWVFVNDRQIIDNGGVHPARSARRTLHLEAGWHHLRLRYENLTGNQYLRFRVRSAASRTPETPPVPYCSELAVDGGATPSTR